MFKKTKHPARLLDLSFAFLQNRTPRSMHFDLGCVIFVGVDDLYTEPNAALEFWGLVVRQGFDAESKIALDDWSPGVRHLYR